MTRPQTMTVRQLMVALATYPPDLPVFAEWESVIASLVLENFRVAETYRGHGLVIDVEHDCQ